MTRRALRMLYHDRVMKQSKTFAMSILLHLIEHGSGFLLEKHQRSLSLWDEVTEKIARLTEDKDPDRLVPICDVEKYLRKNFLSIVFNTTAQYGNKEVERIYSWKEGTIGPMNTLLNRAGAQLRFLAMTRYPFPLPTKRYVRRIKRVKKRRKYKEYFQWDYAYGGTKRRPTIIITHPMLPSLDFVDLIRAHLVELCRQCFIHSVPISDSTKFINLLIFRLRSLLDEFYLVGFDKKRRAFTKITRESLSILDSVIERIKGQHGITSGYPLRMTGSYEDSEVLSLEPKELASKVDDPKIKGILTTLKNDVARFSSKLNKLISRSGTRIHKRMAWGIIQPFSAMSIMLGGDYLTSDKTGYLLAAETPVKAGRGKVDYTLSVRKIPEYIENVIDTTQGLWPPRFTLDLKTKSAFNWGVGAKPHNSTKSFIADFPLKKRFLTDLEWDILIKNTPTNTEKEQVNKYSKALLEEYRTIAKDDLKLPSSCLEGIILVDAHDFPSRSRHFLPKFIKGVYEQIRDDISDMRKKDSDRELEYPRMLFEPELRWPMKTKVAIITFAFKIEKGVTVVDTLPTPIPQQSLSKSNPFENRRDDLRRFILYLSADDVSSPGDSAGWIAQYWHGLWFVYDTAKEYECKKVVWIDLAGEFSNEVVRDAMLRLKFHHNKIRQFTQSIDFVDFSPEIEGALFSGADLPSAETIGSRIKDYDLAIVSGINTVREVAPTEYEGLVDTLIVHIANATSQEGNCTIWFGRPSPLATTSALYKRQQLQPFRHDSPLQPYIDEIVMNIPFTPRRGGSKVPKYDYVRGLVSIVSDKKKGIKCTTIGIPPLIGWSKKFLSREPSEEEQKLKSKLRTRPPSTFRWLKKQEMPTFSKGMAIELFPFLESWRAKSKDSKKHRNVESLKIRKKKLDKTRGPKGSKGLYSRLKFSTNLCIPSPSQINTERAYRQTKLMLKPFESIPRPPNSSELVYSKFSSNEAARIELVRLQDTCTFLLGLRSSSSYLKEQCKEFVKVLAKAVKLPSMDMLQRFAEFFKNSRYSSQIWYRLLWGRDWLDGWSMPSGLKTKIAKLRVDREDLLQYYGNYLIFMIASLTENYNLHQTEIQFLWEMVRPWVTLQMGARPRAGVQPESEYDTANVYAQLKAKASFWNREPYPTATALSNIRYGLRVDVTKSNPGTYRWYIFEDGAFSNRFIAGCIEQDAFRLGPLPLIRANAVTSLDEISSLADFRFSNCMVRPFLIAEHQGINILYETEQSLQSKRELTALTNPSSFTWNPVGMIRYGTRSRNAKARLRYIKVLTLGMQYPSIRYQLLPERSADFGERLFEHIKTIGEQTQGVTRVKCRLGGTIDEGGIYFQGLGEKEWNSIKHNNKNQAIQNLLLPYNAGIAVQGKYSWDPLTDFHFRFGGEELRKEVVSRIQLDKDEGV